MKDKLKKYINENMEKKSFFKRLMKSVIYEEEALNTYEESSMPVGTTFYKSSNINKGLKDSDVYNKVHIDRRLFSKIRSDSKYHPKKETVILLGLSLELTEDEIDKLLETLSYSLPKNNYFDLIIRFCFKERIYDIMTINDFLDSYKCKLLDY